MAALSVVQIVDESVSLFDVAETYGLGWGSDPGRPFQVHCPMHNDSTPSARVYPASNSGFCWTCQAPFGPSRLAACQEGVSIGRAAHILAARYAVDLRPDADLTQFRALAERWEDGPDTDTPEVRRAAGLAVRGVGLPWDAIERLLPLWDALDAGHIRPDDWMDLVRTAANPSARTSE